MASETVIEALGEQVECYRRLAKLATAQHEFVQQSATEELIEVLLKRQAELDRIAELEREIAPAKRRWGGFIDSLDHQERDAAESMMAETRKLLEEITAADRNDALVLQQRKLNLGRQINQASAARQVNRNYATAAYGTRVASMDRSA